MQLYAFSSTHFLSVVQCFSSLFPPCVSVNEVIIKDNWSLHFSIHLFKFIFAILLLNKHKAIISRYLLCSCVDTVDAKESSIVPVWAHSAGPMTDTWTYPASEGWLLWCTRCYGLKKAINEKSLHTVVKACNYFKCYNYLDTVLLNLSSEIIVSIDPQNLPEHLLCTR